MSDETKTEAYKARARAVFAEMATRDGWDRVSSSLITIPLGEHHLCSIQSAGGGGGFYANIADLRRRDDMDVVKLRVDSGDSLATMFAAAFDRAAEQAPGEAEFAEVERLVGIAPQAADARTSAAPDSPTAPDGR